MSFLDLLALGLNTALTPVNLLYCVLGVTLGMIVGVIPGIGTMAAISMLFPITFYLEPTTALIMLAGMWYGTGYGGRTASILLNLPGTPANAVTCLDGYPMAKQGRAGVALFMTTIASFVGGCFGTVILMMFSPVVTEYALRFGPAEYFSLMVLGLVASCMLSDGAALKGIAMVVVGILLGAIGSDVYTGLPRLTFGILDLSGGLSIIALAMGIFGLSEIISSIGRVNKVDPLSTGVGFKGMKPSRDEVRRSWMPVLRGSSLGAFFGTLPGTGPAVASFLSYAVEKRVSKEPQRFGKGAIEGIMAPEAADNSAEMTSFIPTLTLGIPGSATMALMIGVLMIHGITPGPMLATTQPDLFWGLIMSFWIGNIVLVILNVPLIGVWVRLLTIPYHLLYPSIVVIICVGCYSVGFSAFDVWILMLFGLLGFIMHTLGFPAAPMLLGFVLGPMLEENFRRAMQLSRGNLETFIDRPISLALLLVSAVLIGLAVRSSIKARREVALGEKG